MLVPVPSGTGFFILRGSMARVIAFIDGFNLYHSISRNKSFRKYKWLNLAKLIRCFVTSKDEIRSIYYFTAYANWVPDRAKRHKHYVRVLEHKKVEPVFGEFKVRDRYCSNCKTKFETHEEKETDVNIAVKLFQTAVDDQFDTALIVSGDSDLVPAIRAVKESFPHKSVKVVIPPGIYAENLKRASDAHMKIKEKHLKTSQLEDPVVINGVELFCPSEWK